MQGLWYVFFRCNRIRMQCQRQSRYLNGRDRWNFQRLVHDPSPGPTTWTAHDNADLSWWLLAVNLDVVLGIHFNFLCQSH